MKTPTKLKAKDLKTAKDFHDFYKSIPDKEWCVEELTKGNKHCAIGHLKVRAASRQGYNALYNRLDNILMDIGFAESINDNSDERFTAFGARPRTRIVNALKKVMAIEAEEAAMDEQ